MRLHALIHRLHLQKKIALWARRVVAFEADRDRRRCVLVRNRWQLVWRCMQQPNWHRSREDRRLHEELKNKLRKEELSV